MMRIGAIAVFGISTLACAYFAFAATQSITIEVLPLGSVTPTPTQTPTPHGTPTSTPSVSVTPTNPPSGGGGGGGAGFSQQPTTRVIFNGRAYPNNTVTVLQDAQVVASTVAGPDSQFQVGLSGLSPGNYMFSLYAEDDQGRRSSLSTFPIGITQGALTNVSGIFIAPTLDADKTQVKQGDTLTLFGKTTQNATITIQVNSGQPDFFTTTADAGGAFLYKLDTSGLDMGQHSSKVKAASAGDISEYSQAISFLVGNKNVAKSVSDAKRFDFNGDGRVNLTDLSMELFWYKKPLTADAAQKFDFNHDGIVDLRDISILIYYWTG